MNSPCLEKPERIKASTHLMIAEEGKKAAVEMVSIFGDLAEQRCLLVSVCVCAYLKDSEHWGERNRGNILRRSDWKI